MPDLLDTTQTSPASAAPKGDAPRDLPPPSANGEGQPPSLPATGGTAPATIPADARGDAAATAIFETIVNRITGDADQAKADTVSAKEDEANEPDDLEDLDVALGLIVQRARHNRAPKLDELIAAALLADGFARSPAILRDLHAAVGVALLELPEGADHEAVQTMLTEGVLQEGSPPTHLNDIDFDKPLADDASALAVIRVMRSPMFRDPVVLATGLRELGYGVLALRDAEHDLPAAMVEEADHHVTLALRPCLVEPILSRVVRDARDAMEGLADRLGAIAGHVTVADLRTAVARRRPLAQVIERLEKRVAKRRRAMSDAPTLEALPGYGEAKAIGLNIAADLRAYAAGKLSWAEVDPGLVLAGPPGTGKSLFCRALAKSAGVPLVIGSFAAWQAHKTGHLGDMLAAMRATFAEARGHRACILLIDELDSVGDRAKFPARHKDYSTQVVNALLELLDGAERRDGVFVIGATNYPQDIDPAVLRSGRLDRIIEIDRPTREDLAAMLRFHLSEELADADLTEAALLLRGGTGADAAAAVRRARNAARRATRDLTIDDLVEAAADGRALPTGEARRRIAAHEAAHAVAAQVLKLGRIGGVSIHAGGGAMELQPDDWAILTPQHLQDHIVQRLAGRAAEMLVWGTPSAGAGGGVTSDLAQATALAVRAIGSWGLGADEPIWVGRIETDREFELATARLHAPVQALLKQCHARASQLVAAHRSAIQRIADRLDETGDLDANDIAAAMADVNTLTEESEMVKPHEEADKTSGVVRDFG